MEVNTRTIAILLVSICLSIAIGLAMLIATLAHASVAAPLMMPSAPRDACSVTAAWSPHQLTGALCPVRTRSASCCTRQLLG